MTPSTKPEYRLSELQRHLTDVVDMFAESKDRIIELEETVQQLTAQSKQNEKETTELRRQLDELARSIPAPTSTTALTGLNQRVTKLGTDVALINLTMTGLHNLLTYRLSEPDMPEAANG